MNKFSKKLVALVMCGALLIPAGAMAGEVDASSNETVSLADYENYIKSTNGIASRSASSNLSVQAFDYMEAAMDNSTLNDVLNEYHDVAETRDETYEMFESNLNGTYQEVKANNFNNEQAEQLLKSAADLETGNAEVTKFTPIDPSEIPAPPHSDAIVDVSNSSVSLLSNSDISGRDNTDVTGIGYEVKSLSGFNRTTADCYLGYSNVGDVAGGETGVASYMFYTFGSASAGAQDLGILYKGNGQWCPVVNGKWTGYAEGPARMKSGDRIYFKVWIDSQNQINFQGFDGSDFSTILFQGVYSTWGQLPANGSGVTINRQITYAANAGHQKDHTGYYLNNARFDRAYLYNNYSTAMFTDGNTDSSRRGKFGAVWAPSSNVTINSNTHWYSENISIDLT